MPTLLDWRRRATAAAGLALAALALGCAPRPLLARALAARGGPFRGVLLCAEGRVYAGVPGRWRFARAYLTPDHYAWRVETAGEPDSYLFDGTVVRSFIGNAEVARDASPAAPLRSHARWTGVMLLDGLDAPGVTVEELPVSDVPPGAREGLRVRFADGATYRLGFDAAATLVSIDGPLDLWPLGSGPATVRYADPRTTAGVTLPTRASYFGGDRRLADESIDAVGVDPPGLTPASFVDPASLPSCPRQ
ncbi:MAG: hypothetical protein U0802_07410 [Candidatus Binatia bacterium]